MDLPRSVPMRERCRLDRPVAWSDGYFLSGSNWSNWAVYLGFQVCKKHIDLYWSIHYECNIYIYIYNYLFYYSILYNLYIFHNYIYTCWLQMNIPYLHVSQNRWHVVEYTSTQDECYWIWFWEITDPWFIWIWEVPFLVGYYHTTRKNPEIWRLPCGSQIDVKWGLSLHTKTRKSMNII